MAVARMMSILVLLVLFGHAHSRIANQFDQRHKITTTNMCVYNSECDGCQPGYVRWCRANNCMCEKANGPFNGDLIPGRAYPVGPWTDFQCYAKSKYLPLASYFDPNRGMCIEQYEIGSSFISKNACKGHEILFSRVDSTYYCADQISVFDYTCTENKDCHHLFSESFIAWCQTGMCHAIHTTDRNETINELPHCYNNYAYYCRELQYKSTPLTKQRIDACNVHCQKHYDVAGIPSTSSLICLCYAYKERASHRIQMNEKTVPEKTFKDTFEFRYWPMYIPKMFSATELKDDLIAS